ncbi:MAG TPA: thiamine pyrophosphate-dependent enzyme [Chloroflexota bacterium]
MNRVECLEAFAAVRNGAVVIVSPGLTGHELYHAAHDEATIYNMDMPYASPMCLGIALARPQERVVALEGDGSMLMALGTLTTVARYNPSNLAIVVFDNGCYATTGTGDVPTATAGGTDLAAIARGAGLEQAHCVDELPSFASAIARSLSEPGPWFIVARVDTSDRQGSRPGFPTDITEQAVLFGLEMKRRSRG